MKESQAYKDGWNANIDDKSIFSNPHRIGFNADEWRKGFKNCRQAWDKLPLHKSQPDRK